ncbi:MAG: YitT family protein [Paludibacteraceae bacterium]|nr:YitT family protein [Paludibacteraceae bacterium]MBQ9705610.1 YitT family protein [Paludibacteraceae bacterium]
MSNSYLKQYVTAAYWKGIFLDFRQAIRTKRFWMELVIMTFGMFLGAASVYYFLMPSHLIVGSISGLSIVINTIVHGDADTFSAIVTVINAFLLLMAFLLIGNEFGAKTVYTALILGPMIQLWDRICPSTNFTHRIVESADPALLQALQSGQHVADANGNAYLLDRHGHVLEQVKDSVMSSGLGTGDVLFDLICFVLLLSVCQSLLFRINASTGGLDILAKIINKYLNFDIGKSVTIAGFAICCTAFLINDFRMVVIGLIGSWINGVTLDYFTEGLNKRKRVCIITKDYEMVRQYIIKDLVRGCSLYDIRGGYSNEGYTEIQTLLAQDEFARLMDFMRRSNIRSFTTAGNCSEIYGTWLPHRRLHGKTYVYDEQEKWVENYVPDLKQEGKGAARQMTD